MLRNIQLVSSENLGIAVAINDLKLWQWLNSLIIYIGVQKNLNQEKNGSIALIGGELQE